MKQVEQSRYKPQHAIETEVHRKETENNRFHYDRALSCDVKSDHEEEDYIRNNNLMRSMLLLITTSIDTMRPQPKSSNRITAKEPHLRARNNDRDDLSSSGIHSGIYDEYLQYSNASGPRAKPNGILSGFMNSRPSKEFHHQINHTEKVNKNTPKPESRKEKMGTILDKQYYKQFVESLNRQSLDYSRSTVSNKETQKAPAYLKEYKEKYNDGGAKRSFFSHVLPSNRFEQ